MCCGSQKFVLVKNPAPIKRPMSVLQTKNKPQQVRVADNKPNDKEKYRV
jgi:hypothetical protein